MHLSIHRFESRQTVPAENRLYITFDQKGKFSHDSRRSCIERTDRSTRITYDLLSTNDRSKNYWTVTLLEICSVFVAIGYEHWETHKSWEVSIVTCVALKGRGGRNESRIDDSRWAFVDCHDFFWDQIWFNVPVKGKLSSLSYSR